MAIARSKVVESSLACWILAVSLGWLSCAAPSSGRAPSSAAGAGPANQMDARDRERAARAARLKGELWAMAPRDTRLGIVVSGAAVDSVVAVLAELRRLLAERPGGRVVLDILARELGTQLVDPTDPATWSRLGIDASAGFAVFGLDAPADQQRMLVVLRVHDLDAFRAATGATRATMDGHAVERSGNTMCMPVGDWYACAEELAILLAVQRAGPDSWDAYEKSIPARERGDVEMLLDASGDSDFMNSASFQRGLRPTGMIAFTARFERGGARLWLWVEARAESAIMQAMVGHDASPTTASASTGAHDLMRAHLPMAAIAEQSGVPATIPLPNGADMRADFFANLTGEFSAYTAGGGFFEYHVVAPFTRPEDGRRAVVGMCQMLASLISPQGILRPLDISATGCTSALSLGGSAVLDFLDELAEDQPWVELSLAVGEDGLLRLDIGGAKERLRRANKLGSESAREISDGAWHMATWGLHFDPYAVLPDGVLGLLRDQLDESSEDVQLAFDLYRWLAGHVYEFGGGAVVRADGVHVVAQLTTFAADPAPAYRAYERALALLLDDDLSGYRAAMARIADEHPSTLAGRYGRELMDEVSMIGQLDTILWNFGVIEGLDAYFARGRADAAVQAPTAPDTSP